MVIKSVASPQRNIRSDVEGGDHQLRHCSVFLIVWRNRKGLDTDIYIVQLIEPKSRFTISTKLFAIKCHLCVYSFI